jgi:hypothetical protein
MNNIRLFFFNIKYPINSNKMPNINIEIPVIRPFVMVGGFKHFD